jgi:hypothetical protein
MQILENLNVICGHIIFLLAPSSEKRLYSLPSWMHNFWYSQHSSSPRSYQEKVDYSWPQDDLQPGFLLLAFASKVRVCSRDFEKRKVYLYSCSANYCFVLLAFLCSLKFVSLICAFHSLRVAKVANCTPIVGDCAITAYSFTFYHSKTKSPEAKHSMNDYMNKIITGLYKRVCNSKEYAVQSGHSFS